MKNNFVYLLAVGIVLSLSSCNNVSTGNMESAINKDTINLPLSSNNTELSETESAFGGNIGGEDYCQAHRYLYHFYSTELINFVGEETFDQWCESITEAESMNIATFINYFQIPRDTLITVERENLTDDYFKAIGIEKEEYFGMFTYSDEQLNAIYSEDQIAINNAFCGPLAFVNEADGELYSIYWLAEHTPEEYVEAGLPMEEVEAVIEKAASEEFGLTELAETAQSKFALALSLESEALPVE